MSKNVAKSRGRKGSSGNQPAPQHPAPPASEAAPVRDVPAAAPAAEAPPPIAPASEPLVLKGTRKRSGREMAKEAREAKDAKAEKPGDPKKRKVKEPFDPVETMKSVLWAVLLFFVIRTFLIFAYSIPSESMEDTLLVGDYLMANNAVFGATLPFSDVRLPAIRNPRRGEIVVFRPEYNLPRMDVVKRVIGIPGDTLRMEDGVVYRNGQRLEEAYAHHLDAFDEPIPADGQSLMDPTVQPQFYGARNHLPILAPGVDARTYAPTRNNWGPVVVPPETYWLMGDNRDRSLDSRYMGPIPREVIRGKPLFIYYSYDKQDYGAPFPRFITAMRWRRIGKPVN